MLAVDTSTRAKISELKRVVQNEDVLWFDVSVENAVPVHVVDTFHELVHVVQHLVFRKVLAPATDQLINVHFHQLEHKRKSPRRAVIQNFVQLDDVCVRGKSAEGLNLAKPIDLLDGVKVVLHALDGNELVRLDVLRLQHLAECPLAFLAQQLVLVHLEPELSSA